jgi:hypothetical protein
MQGIYFSYYIVTVYISRFYFGLPHLHYSIYEMTLLVNSYVEGAGYHQYCGITVR